jgi:hypothetical protein
LIAQDEEFMMRRIDVTIDIFSDPLSLVFTLPVMGDNSQPLLHTQVGKFANIDDEARQHINVHKRPVYQQLEACVDSTTQSFLLLQLGHRIPERYFVSPHDQAVIDQLED